MIFQQIAHRIVPRTVFYVERTEDKITERKTELKHERDTIKSREESSDRRHRCRRRRRKIIGRIGEKANAKIGGIKRYSEERFCASTKQNGIQQNKKCERRKSVPR